MIDSYRSRLKTTAIERAYSTRAVALKTVATASSKLVFVLIGYSSPKLSGEYHFSNGRRGDVVGAVDSSSDSYS